MNEYELHMMPLKKRFWLSVALFLVMAMVCTSMLRARRLQGRTQAELVKAQAGLAKLKVTNLNRRNALGILKTEYLLGVTNISDERLLYSKMDELKARLKPDDLTVSGIEKKGGTVSLPYTLKFINTDYNDFLNTISYLEGAVFPFTTVNSVTIAQADAGGKNVVAFTINGKVLTSESKKP
jgi:hypothetical protein